MHKRSSVIVGTILILVGVLFLLAQFFPSLAINLNISQQWPLIIVSVGALLLISAFLGAPPLAIPGSIVSGIGAILYVQNLTNTWDSWAYIWTLIPGFVGIGMLLSGLLGHQRRTMWREGGRLLLISLVLFLVFGAFFNGLGDFGRFWPVLLILAGLSMLWPRRRSKIPPAEKEKI
ncbi:MAG: hypothetical protein GY805_36530 [Chloroflexi bacterium]|nr:hypothetical protein [Chloroflexota bacterium]